MNVRELLVHDDDAPAIVAGALALTPGPSPARGEGCLDGAGRVVTWGELRQILSQPKYEPGTRVARQPRADVDTIVDLLQLMADGAVPVLAHHRWPQAMADDAFAFTGVGRPWPAMWPASTVLFTSGSTGRPKAVVHDVDAHIANARGALSVMPFSVGHRWLLSLPLGHVGGLAVLFRALVGGGAVVVPSSTDLHESIIAARPTHLSVVAAQLTKIVEDERVLEVLRAHTIEILVGGGPTTPALFARAIAAGLPVRQTWGLTEMGSQVCTSLRQQTSTCGAPLPGRFVRALEDGELVVGGAGRCSGFLDGDVLQTPFLDDGGYATGDLGLIGEDGNVTLTGRRGNRFISGGENIQPEAIEAALAGDDGVVVVVPVDDERFGQRPFAFVSGVAVEVLRARADERLPRFMHPVGVAPLPDSGGLKPRRRELQALAATLPRIFKEPRS